MRVAFTTGDLERVDAHFGFTPRLAVYEVTRAAAELVQVHDFPPAEADGGEAKLEPRLAALDGCALLYTAAIGRSAAARVLEREVHPIVAPEAAAIGDLLAELRTILEGQPPPWLRRALRKGGVRP